MKEGKSKVKQSLPAAVLALAPLFAGCSGALIGNLVIVLLALAIFVGTIRLGGGDDRNSTPPSE